MNDHVQLRDFIERIIDEKERRRDDLRVEDHRRVDSAVDSLREKFDRSVRDVERERVEQKEEYARRLENLNHAHAEAQRVLHTYAQLKDFNELKERVDIEFADRGGQSRSVTTLVKISSALAIIISVAVAVLTYVK